MDRILEEMDAYERALPTYPLLPEHHEWIVFSGEPAINISDPSVSEGIVAWFTEEADTVFRCTAYYLPSIADVFAPDVKSAVDILAAWAWMGLLREQP